MPVDQCKKMMVVTVFFQTPLVTSARSGPQMAYAESRMSLAYVTEKVIGSPTFSMAGSKYLKNAGKDLPPPLLDLLSFCVAFMQAVFTYGGRTVTGGSTFTFCRVATMKEERIISQSFP